MEGGEDATPSHVHPPPQDQGTVTITLDVRDARILRDMCRCSFIGEAAVREYNPWLLVSRQTSKVLSNIYDALASVVPR